MTCANYDSEFICDLLKQVDAKISLITNKDYKNNVYNLGLKFDATDHTDLIDLRNILNKILKCDSCYEDINIEDVVSLTKNKLNKC